MRLTNLDMDALRSFAAGIDAGSFARAADRLGRSTFRSLATRQFGESPLTRIRGILCAAPKAARPPAPVFNAPRVSAKPARSAAKLAGTLGLSGLNSAI